MSTMFAPVNSKKTRQERKHQQRLQQDPQWRAAHPVSAGLVKVVDYVPPRGTYTPPPGGLP